MPKRIWTPGTDETDESGIISPLPEPGDGQRSSAEPTVAREPVPHTETDSQQSTPHSAPPVSEIKQAHESDQELQAGARAEDQGLQAGAGAEDQGLQAGAGVEDQGLQSDAGTEDQGHSAAGPTEVSAPTAQPGNSSRAAVLAERTH